MLHLSSQITAVTVYRKGARVTRVAALEASEGRYLPEVELVDLPLTLDEGSIRLAVRGHGEGATPHAVSYHLSISVPAEEACDPVAEEAELERAALLQAQAEARVETLRATLERMQQVQLLPRPVVEAGPPPPLPTDARLAWLVWARERSAALHTALQAARDELRALTLRLDSLKARHREGKRPRTFEPRRSVVIRLRSPERTALVERISLQLSYDVPGARWSPAYTLRLNGAMAAGQLEMRAIVGQSTGEDWQGVALSLSTALPEPWTELPELKALRLGRAQPQARTGWCKPPVGADALYRDRDAVLGPPTLPRHSTAAASVAEMRSRAQEPVVAAAEPLRAPVLEPPPFAMPQASAGPPAPVAPAPAPQLMMARSRMAAPADRKSAGVTPPPLPPSFDPPPVAVDRALLNYGELRLFPAQDPRRGKLRPMDRNRESQAWQEQLELARASACALEQRVLPPGHLPPASDFGFDYAYVAQAPVDIPSDGHDHPLAILAASVHAKPSYVSVPRASRDVFRWVRIVNPWEGPILAGPVDVYVDRKFLQSNAMPLTHGGAVFELGLGVEASLKIARNVTFEEDTSGLLKRHHELRHRISIEVTNHLTHTANVEILDRVPVPAENQVDLVTVELRSVDPPWVEYEPPGDRRFHGGRQWRLEVPAGQTRMAHAFWVIMVPAQHELVGGNRREPV